MEILANLLQKNIPLLAFMVVGFVLAKRAKVELKTIAKLLMYFAMPIIVFDGISKVQLSSTNLSIPILIFIIACVLCILGYYISSIRYKDSKKNLLALSAGKGNYLYFGLPLIIALIGDSIGTPLLILMSMGFILFEATLGMFITAKGHLNTKQSIKKILQIPYIYAFILGVIVNLLDIKLGSAYSDFIGHSKGFLITSGNLIVGVAIAQIKSRKIDIKFLSIAFLIKFLIRPLIAFIIIYIDQKFFGFYDSTIYQILFILSLIPLSVNSIAIASELGLDTQDIAISIAISTIFALFFIPIIVSYIQIF